MAAVDGDPRTVVPDLFARLTQREQAHASKAFGLYYVQAENEARSTQGGDPLSVARDAILRGVRDAAFLRTAPILILLAFGVGVCVTSLSVLTSIIAVLFAAIGVALLVKDRRRERLVDQWFKSRGAE